MNSKTAPAKQLRKIALIPATAYELNNYVLNIQKHPYALAREKLRTHGYELSTIDTIDSWKDICALLVFDLQLLTTNKNFWEFFTQFKGRKILVVVECPIIDTLNSNKYLHDMFDKIITWNDDDIDNQKYFKYVLPQMKRDLKTRFAKKGVCIINANKYSSREGELYSRRREIVDFFQKNNIHTDVYGAYWNTLSLKQRVVDLLSLLQRPTLKNIYNYLHLFMPIKNNKGTAEDKIETMSKYSFSICLENTDTLNGYITEKIWDCLFARTIPLYLGAPNISEYVPKSCYIDVRNYTLKELADLIQNMPNSTQESYRHAIESFLKSTAAKKWLDATWAEKFSGTILLCLKG